MERLTKWLNDKKNLCIKKCEKECVEGYTECHKCEPFKDVMIRLAKYEDAEEQSLLLRLPCKVGDTVYLINHSICENRKIPLKCVVDEFTFDHGNRCYAVLNGAMSFYALRRFKSVNIKQFGLTVFLTKEEAEAIMDERNGR